MGPSIVPFLDIFGWQVSELTYWFKFNSVVIFRLNLRSQRLFQPCLITRGTPKSSRCRKLFCADFHSKVTSPWKPVLKINHYTTQHDPNLICWLEGKLHPVTGATSFWWLLPVFEAQLMSWIVHCLNSEIFGGIYPIPLSRKWTTWEIQQEKPEAREGQNYCFRYYCPIRKNVFPQIWSTTSDFVKVKIVFDQAELKSVLVDLPIAEPNWRGQTPAKSPRVFVVGPKHSRNVNQKT